MMHQACEPPDISRIMDGLSPAEQRTALIWLSGAEPAAFEAALRFIQEIRKAIRASA